MKQFLSALMAVILGIVAIILFRTLTYGGPPEGVEKIELPDVPTFSAEAAAEHISQAIKFKTVTIKGGDPVNVEAAKPWLDLHDWLAGAYPRVHATMELTKVADYSLLYKWQGSDSGLAPIILMAHQDVVPVNIGTLEDWTGAPFSGDIIDGYIYGRGALDDKGSLVTIMEAGEALIASGFVPERTVYFMFGHDEEVAGTGAQSMVDVLYARGVRAELVLDEGFFVIKDSPLTGKPFGFVGVSEKGYVSLELTATAAGGHSSNPPRNSANVRLARAILALEDNQMKADFSKPPVTDLFRAAADDMGFTGRMALANLWLFRGLVEKQLGGAGDAMIRTTTAPTILEGAIKENVLPQRSRAVVNFRLHPSDTLDDLMTHVEKVTQDIDGLEINIVRGGIASEASPVSPTDNRAYSVLASVAGEVGGGVPTGPALVLGGTDARFAYKISDNVYRFYPSAVTLEELAGFHGTNERLSVENARRMVKGYMQLILAMDAE